VDHGRLERLLSALYGTDHAAPVLRRLCLVCVDHVGADGASVTGVDDGIRRVLDASDGDIARIAGLQLELEDGPCVDALATLAVVTQADLTSVAARTAWPRFAPAAHREGVVAAFAFPLVNGRSAVGTLDIYNRTAGSLDSDRTADVTMLADLTTLAIDQAEVRFEIDDVGIRVEPQATWAHSATVHNACGMISQQLGISVDEALLRLRTLAFVHNRGVDDLARDVVARQYRVEPWSGDD